MKQEKKNHSNKPDLLKTVRQVLEKADLTTEPILEGEGYVVRFSDGPPVRGIALVYEADSRFVFYLEFLKPVPKKERPRVAEYVTRANFGLTIGNFEMDYDSGLVRYKCSLDYAGAELSEALARNVVLDAMDAIEFYTEGLLSVAQAKQKPLEAIEKVEQGPEVE